MKQISGCVGNVGSTDVYSMWTCDSECNIFISLLTMSTISYMFCGYSEALTKEYQAILILKWTV